MTNHPNRSKVASAASNPAQAEIRAARDSAGLTQSGAAALIYRTARNWQQWENGERKMDPALWELFRLKIALQNVRT